MHLTKEQKCLIYDNDLNPGTPTTSKAHKHNYWTRSVQHRSFWISLSSDLGCYFAFTRSSLHTSVLDNARENYNRSTPNSTDPPPLVPRSSATASPTAYILASLAPEQYVKHIFSKVSANHTPRQPSYSLATPTPSKSSHLRQKRTMAVPGYCNHSFNLLKSESTLIQWVCSMCYSGPY